MKLSPPLLDDASVLSLTPAGERQLREPGTALSSAQLEGLVLIGARTTVSQILQRARGIPPDVMRNGLNDLVKMGLISVNSNLSPDVIDAGNFFSLDGGYTTTSTDIPASIDADTEFLRRNGYYVNMTRHLPVRNDIPSGRKLDVLIVEDTPEISKLLQIFFKMEGLETRTAANREEVVAALRRPTPPDLVILDVRLPDVNGFDILAKMRQHSTLKEAPVIMLTAESTREAVIKGITGGADGFVSKPFEIGNLIKAVKAVLGKKHES